MEDEEALRVAGYLLEAHPTIGAFCRSADGTEVSGYGGNACMWCLAGAVLFVGRQCQHRDSADMRLLFAAAARLGKMVACNPMASLTHRWDHATPAAQRTMIDLLKTTGL